jgi:hypothetical protein
VTADFSIERTTDELTIMKRAVALAALLVVSTVSAVGLVGGASATAYITGVQVTPEQPVPGERFTLTTNVTVAQQSPSDLSITDVYVRKRGETNDVARVENLGTLPPGSDISIPLTASFDTPGTRELRVTVVGRSDGELIRLQYPVVVTVRQGGPQVGIEVGDAVVGTKTGVRVTAVNGEDSPVRNVRLALSGRDVTVRNATRVLPTLAPGESRTFNFTVTPTTSRAELEARLQYTSESGTTRVVSDNATVEADPLREDVRLDASVDGSGASPPIVVDVSNLGNAPLEDVVVEATRDGATVARRPLADVAPDETRTVSLNVTGVAPGDLGISVAYETGGVTGETTTTLDYTANPGSVELTGIDFERQDDRVHIMGSASNVGLSQVDSVVVRVVPSEGVTPARPNREYFVGSIPASDFVSFDLYAEIAAGTEAIPIEVSYIVDGRRVTTQTEVNVSDLEASSPDQGGSGLPRTLLLVGGVVAALVLVGVGAYAYRRR